MMFFALAVLCAIVALFMVPGMALARTRSFFITEEQAYNGMLRADIPPVLTVDDGDTVVFNTLMLLGGRLSPDMTFDEMFAVRGGMIEKGLGTYAFTGPFYINGAEPGDVLEVRVKRLVPGKHAVTHIYPDPLGIGGLPEGFEKGWLKGIYLSGDRKSFEFARASPSPSGPSWGPWQWPPGRGKCGPQPFPAILPAIWTIKS